MSYFQPLQMLPEDPILSITQHYKDDLRPKKINLGVGAYKDSDGYPVVFEAVRKADAEIFKKQLDKEYQPIDGTASFRNETLKLVLGEDSPILKQERAYCTQTIGGSGALRIGAELLHSLGLQTAYISTPTWSNHQALLSKGGLKVDSYPYYDNKTNTLDFNATCNAIKKMPPKSVILLQACCHNPTGIDFSSEQWKELSTLIKKQGVFPFFDMAYQGFKASLEEDRLPIKIFLDDGHEEMAIATAYSKNFGLYGERMGALTIVTKSKELAAIVASHVRVLIRGCYSSPPISGARIIDKILSTKELKKEWTEQLAQIRGRINLTRKALADALAAKGLGDYFHFIRQQSGLFSFIGIDKNQVEILKKDFGIYMLGNGRINVAGLNEHNLNDFVEALLSVMNTKKENGNV